jgi:hypothetical protein
MRKGRIILFVAFLLLPALSGYGLAIYSDRWVSGTLSSTEQHGFPLPWKTGYTVPCYDGYDCFGLRIAYNQLNFAVDWVFYSIVGYSILGLLIFTRRRIKKKTGQSLNPPVTPIQYFPLLGLERP